MKSQNCDTIPRTLDTANDEQYSPEPIPNTVSSHKSPKIDPAIAKSHFQQAPPFVCA
jgi:hypothetical protein